MIKISDKWIAEIADDYFIYIKKRIERKKSDENDSTKLPYLISDDNDNISDEKLKKLLCEKIEIDHKLSAFINNLTKLESEVTRLEKKHKKQKQQKQQIFYIQSQIRKMKSTIEYSELCSIEKYIDYTMVSEGVKNGEKWRDIILNKINVSVCPYCNRNYIDVFREQKEGNDKIRSIAELDHFYSQNKHPYLALSLYNFIPSCKNCNSKFKGDNIDSTKLVYPYEEGFGENCVFKTDQNLVNFLYGQDLINIDMEISENIDDDLKQKIEENIELFRLKNIYKNHSKEARDIFNKQYLFNDTYINEIKETFPISITNKELKELIFDMYEEEEDINRPIGKFKRDIYNQNN